jgi:hypothetical protein
MRESDADTNSDSYTYGFANGNAHSNGHTYRNGYAYGWDSYSDSDVHAGRHSWAVEHGESIPDHRCALWVCPDSDALLRVWRCVQRHASERCEPAGSGHRNVGIASTDALYQ